MEKIFEEKICSICKKHNTDNCKKAIQKENKNNMNKIYCSQYQKDELKIEPYVEPIFYTTRKKSKYRNILET